MVKRKHKRKPKTTVLLVREGERREQLFYERLYECCQPEQNGIHINTAPEHGGTANSILATALKRKHSRDRVYAWFDADSKLSKEMRDNLAEAWGIEDGFESSISDENLQFQYNIQMRNPILIVSAPVSCDGFLVELLGNVKITSKHKTAHCKNAFDSLIGGNDREKERIYYQKNLNRQKLQKLRGNNRILNLLMSMFES